ncbi:hypothetical protein DM860_014533 [Cuscuta australis]|uniref:Secreted protein n=1 Tax=Cuscuta australis TaxID=267555 RepID=A0A328E2D2_9ASTE|nr:hypothetical protein DM860_014533 [Cuscuta australis]
MNMQPTSKLNLGFLFLCFFDQLDGRPAVRTSSTLRKSQPAGRSSALRRWLLHPIDRAAIFIPSVWRLSSLFEKRVTCSTDKLLDSAYKDREGTHSVLNINAFAREANAISLFSS